MHTIFRVWRSGPKDCIALFPGMPTDHADHCWSYEHIGQGGAADYNLVISLTRPARAGECKELHQELTDLGYLVERRQRRQRTN